MSHAQHAAPEYLPDVPWTSSHWDMKELWTVSQDSIAGLLR